MLVRRKKIRLIYRRECVGEEGLGLMRVTPQPLASPAYPPASRAQLLEHIHRTSCLHLQFAHPFPRRRASDQRDSGRA